MAKSINIIAHYIIYKEHSILPYFADIYTTVKHDENEVISGAFDDLLQQLVNVRWPEYVYDSKCNLYSLLQVCQTIKPLIISLALTLNVR